MSAAPTLPDLLRDGLALVFVGINPSNYSVSAGHYFARPGNRFWPCFSESRLSLRARQGIGVERLLPVHDRNLKDYGIGFTDVVKHPTPNVTTLARAQLVEGATLLRDKLERHRPRIACFHGVTGYRPFSLAAGLTSANSDLQLGLQPHSLGPVQLFVVPNPSGANAHFKLADQTEWYNRLADHIHD